MNSLPTVPLGHQESKNIASQEFQDGKYSKHCIQVTLSSKSSLWIHKLFCCGTPFPLLPALPNGVHNLSPGITRPTPTPIYYAGWAQSSLNSARHPHGN